jgi:hypothetical protein
MWWTSMRRWGWVALVALVACEPGQLSELPPEVTLNDWGVPPGTDGGPGVDMGTPSGDLGPGVDLGPMTDPDLGPDDPCEGVSCGAGASCSGGSCRCLPGFVDVGGGTCEPVEPGDPAGRTETDVCDAWNEGRVENAVGGGWTEGPTTCDPGTLSDAAIEDTVRRVNMYRWLAGLDPVTDDPAQHAGDQECAVMMDREGRLSHDPPESWSCYTAAGAAAAGSSNLALGSRSSPAAIDLYMGDRGVTSLGHRRWIVAPRLGKIGIGFAGRGQCLGVFDGTGSSDRPWTAYPNQGPAPIATAQHSWSFHMNAGLRDATVTVQSGGSAMPVSVYYPGGNYGRQDAIAWDPDGWSPTAGTTYEVTIDGFSGGPITYSVTLVDC